METFPRRRARAVAVTRRAAPSTGASDRAQTDTPPLSESVATARAHLFGEQDVYFVPVRHHSPACAFALRHLLREIKPKAVLIEGPDDLDHLLPLLQHAQTRAPVAWLCQATNVPPQPGGALEKPVATETRSAFFPFCDYSPEWIAIREGAAMGAEVALIDLPWSSKAAHRSEREADDSARSLMEERYFAHSRYLTTMAAQLGCIDHHELWDRLFELRAPESLGNWRDFFGDVFAWCAMARLDYEPEVLETELSLPRERHMAGHIKRWREVVRGPIVVVTGGFHTPELIMRWPTMPPVEHAVRRTNQNAWLIRYSFDRLDALNGYAAGMPSPSYYQRVWDQLENAAARGDGANPYAAVTIECLTSFAQEMRAQDQIDAMSTALVQAAAVQAQRLAALRGNAGPGRQDLLDAIRSCFIKGAVDEGTRGFTADLRRFLGGTRIGDIPASAGSPPLIEDARRRARAAGVRVDDTTPRDARLDLYRKPAHRERSRYFHAMAYLDARLASWLCGPDFLANTGLHLLFEEWRVAWSPMVEARLIELAADGTTVAAACMVRLQREQEALAQEGRGRNASAAVILLVRACLIGLHSRLPELLTALATHLDEDPSLASVVDCGHRLVTLWRSREPLGVQQHPQLRAMLAQTWVAVLLLLPNLSQSQEDDEIQGVKQLVALRELGLLLSSLDAEMTRAIDLEPLRAALERFAKDAQVAPAVCGASTALLFLDGYWNEQNLDAILRQHFGTGATPRDAIRFLTGVMTAAPELLLRIPALLRGLDQIVASWDDDSFIAHLPDFRQSFAQLKPQESAALASQLAALYDLGEQAGESLLQTHYETTEADLVSGSRLQLLLTDALRKSGLQIWLDISADDMER